MTYFKTDPKWLTTIAVWASMIEDIEEIWLFGSRATGRRREKAAPDETPDLDLAVFIRGSDASERQSIWTDWAKIWRQQVQALLPVPADMQPCDHEVDDRVRTGVRVGGVRIYSRTGGGA